MLVKSRVFIRKMKAPLKNKIWGVYNKQMLLTFLCCGGFRCFPENKRWDALAGRCRPLVADTPPSARETPSSGRHAALQGRAAASHFVLNLPSHLQVNFFNYSEFSACGSSRKSGGEKIFGNVFSTFKNTYIRHFQPNLVKVETTGLCSHKIRAQWSVWPKWLVLLNLTAKCLCELVPDEALLSLDWASGGRRGTSLGRREAVQRKLLALCKSELPQHFHDAHYANLFSTILSLKSLNMGGGDDFHQWIICARV